MQLMDFLLCFERHQCFVNVVGKGRWQLPCEECRIKCESDNTPVCTCDQACLSSVPTDSTAKSNSKSGAARWMRPAT